MYGHAAPRKHLATRAGQHVWPPSKPTEDHVKAIGSSRATSGHDLSQNGYGGCGCCRCVVVVVVVVVGGGWWLVVVVGCWLLVVGWWLVVGGWWLVVGGGGGSDCVLI